MSKTTGVNDYMKFLQWFFEQVMPKYGFTPRQMQTELAKEIFAAMSNRGIFLAEAAVGTGKTLAYLLPAILIRRGRINESILGATLPDGHAMPILIATSSIALQKALITDYIPMLSEILMERRIIKKPLTAALRKGKKHYLCERRFAGFSKTANTSTLAALKPLHKYDIVDLSMLKGITSYMKHGINVVEQCSQNCPLYGICRYTQYLRNVNRGGYDFQVTNHNLFLADMLHRVRDKKPVMPEYQAVIVDEAHKFLDAAQDMYGVELSLMELYRATCDLSGFKFTRKQRTKDLFSLADRVYSKSYLLFQFLNKEVPAYLKDDTDVGRFATKIRSRVGKLIRDLKTDIDVLVEIMPRIHVTPKFAERYKSTKRALTNISEALAGFTHHKDLIFWLENGERPPDIDETKNKNLNLTILRGMSKILGDLLFKDFWSKKIPMVLISGTLSAAGSFEHVKRKTGLDNVPSARLFETSKPSPFNFQKNSLLYISEKIPFPENTSPSYIKAVSADAEKLITAANGHTAMLFTSYKAMDLVHERILALNLPYPIFRMDRSAHNALEQFKRSGNGILFASGALWEGVDIPGDILSMLIIVRLPFAVPDPLSEWERTHYSGIDEYKNKVIVPEMLVKLKQGFGRLIRLETDTGAVAILDSRVSKHGAYRKQVLDALPKCQVTSEISEVSRFMRKKKLPTYFE